MTKGRSKNIELRKAVIIELAKANDNKSIPELSILTKIPFETIDNILKEKDISILIDKSHKKIQISTKTGYREAYKYKLKPCLDNLLAVFKYLGNRKYQKEIMQTAYFKNHIPFILEKLKTITTSVFELFEETVKEATENIIKSPSAVGCLLFLTPEIIIKYEKKCSDEYTLFYLLQSLVVLDKLEFYI